MSGEMEQVEAFDRLLEELIQDPDTPGAGKVERKGFEWRAALSFLSPGEWARVGITIVALVYVVAASILVMR